MAKHVFIVTLIILCTLCLPGLADRANAETRILFISSYHPAFPTFHKQIDGLKSALPDTDCILDIEFMDSKRFTSQEWLQRFHDTLEKKIRKVAPYDLIITADDNALIFVEKHKDALFPGLPVVFFGVNNQARAHRIGADSEFTGIIEASSMKATLDMIWQLLPETETLHIIVDGTPSGQGDLKTLQPITVAMTGKTFKTLSLEDFSWKELAFKLKTLDANDALLLLSAYRDKNREGKIFDDSVAFLVEHSRNPIFHLWEHGIGEGLVGGKVVSHYEQGYLAGKAALQILSSSATPEEIPVMSGEEANRYIVDHRALARFDIPEERLPEETRIINAPATLYDRHRTAVIVTGAGTVFLLLFSAALCVIIHRLRQSRKALRMSNSKLKILFEESPLGMILFDENGVIRDCNDQMVHAMGSSREKLIGFDTATQASAKMRKAIGRALQGNISDYEGPYTSETGNKTTYIRVRFNPVIREGRTTQVIATLEVVAEQTAQLRQFEKQTQGA